MLMTLMEKKGKSVKTKVSFARKEWELIPEIVRKQYEKETMHQTKKNVYFIFDGDLINRK